MPELNLERIQKNNWKQGVIIEDLLKTEIITGTQFYEHIKDSDALILYTQDCDLINLDLAKEPYVEFFCVKKIPSINKNYLFGKNPRKMHLELFNDSFFEFDINKRLKIDRSILVDIPLEANNPIVSRRKMDMVLDWFSKKYTRPAFPNEFNEIIKSIPSIDKKLTKFNSEFSNIKRIFFSLEPEEEIAASENYSLDIYILLDGLLLDSKENSKDDIISKFEKLFTTERIKLNVVDCLFEDEMTIYELGIFKVWDKEYITLKNNFAN
ncbi:MAG: hypothetical protein JJE21_08675 [Spirochaetaceae bacterium]|nr:hypothetical protein [Spirochaetaceae bacterium]